MTSDIPYRRNGKIVSREEFEETAKEWPVGKRKIGGAGPMTSRAYDSSKPLVSVAAGCHPSQVKEFNEIIHDAGMVGVHHRPDGAAIFTGAKARDEYLKSRQLHDNDSFN